MPFNNASDRELTTHSAAVVVAFTPEIYTHVMSLFPTPAAYAELHARLEGGYPGYLKGDPEKVKDFEEDRGEIRQLLTMLSGLARTAAIKDPTVPEKLALGHLPARNISSNVTLTEPQGAKIFYDPKGNIYATVTKVHGAKGYQIWLCEGDPNIDANWRLIASATNSRRIPLAGINRANKNWLRIRAMRGSEAGPWSNFVTLSPS